MLQGCEKEMRMGLDCGSRMMEMMVALVIVEVILKREMVWMVGWVGKMERGKAILEDGYKVQ